MEKTMDSETQHPPLLIRRERTVVWEYEGREYLDCTQR